MKRLHQLIPEAQFQIIPNGPHVLNSHNPKEFAEKVRRFLELQK